MTAPIDSLVVDVSNYDWDTFNAQAFYDAGVRRAIVGSQVPAYSCQMIEQFAAVGITTIATYDLPYFGSDGTTQPQMERAIALAQKYKIPLVFADAEIDANLTNVPEWRRIPTPSVAQRQAEFRWCQAAIKSAGLQRGTYTNEGWWNPHMGGSTEWADTTLWMPIYGPNGAPRAPITSAGFGGWAAVWAHQYTSTHVINGRVRDMSYLFAETTTEPQEVDDMTPEEVQALIDKSIAGLVPIELFQHFMNLSLNGGPGQFADAHGNPAPLTIDKPLTARVEAVEKAQAGTQSQWEGVYDRVGKLETKVATGIEQRLGDIEASIDVLEKAPHEPAATVAPHTHVPGGVA